MEHFKSTIGKTLLLAVLSSLPFSVLAKGDAMAGQEKSRVCEACHGTTGKSIDPSYPNLAGQHESYLVKSLADYRSGRRQNPIMAGFAGPLSNEDIEDLAAWFASQKGLEDISIK